MFWEKTSGRPQTIEITARYVLKAIEMKNGKESTYIKMRTIVDRSGRL
jgi:hypothetical protein